MDVLKIWCEAAPPGRPDTPPEFCRQDIPDALVDEVVLGEDPEKLSFGVLASQHDSPTTGIGITCRHSGLSSPNLDFGWIIRAAVHAKAKELTETQWKDKAIRIDNPRQASFDWKTGGVNNVDVFLIIKTEPLALTMVVNRRKGARSMLLVLEEH